MKMNEGDITTGVTQAVLDETKGSLDRVQQWVEMHNYRAYEPFDGLSSWARPLTLGNLFAQRLLQQAIRQCPMNLRPLLGVRPKDSSKGQGYMAWGYLLLYRATELKPYLEKAVRCLNWLEQNKVPRFQHHSWSNVFDYASRNGYYTKDDPIIVWTALIGHAFMEGYDLTQDYKFLQVAESACRWISELPREKTDRGNCLSYLAGRQLSVHNANMLGAGLLARTAASTDNEDFRRVVRSAMEYSCASQHADGSWWYAEAPDDRWRHHF